MAWRHYVSKIFSIYTISYILLDDRYKSVTIYSYDYGTIPIIMDNKLLLGFKFRNETIL